MGLRIASLAAAADAAVAAAEAEGLHLDRTTANPTGYTGVKQTGVKGDRYQANGYKHGKNFSLGTFGVPEEAALAVARWRAKGCPSPFSQRPKAAAAADDEGDAPADGASPPKKPLRMSDLLAKVGRSLEQKGRAGEARAVTILGAQYSEGRVGYAEAMQALAQLIGKDEIVAFVRRAAHGLE